MRAVKRRKNPREREGLSAWLLASPVLLYIACVLLVPCIWGVVISFTDKKIGMPAHFNGIENYISLLLDKTFWSSLGVTLVFTCASVVMKVIFGTILALLLNSKIKCRAFFRSALVIPWTLSILIATLTWKWLLSDIGGAFSYILNKLGLVRKGFSFFTTSGRAMFAVVMVNVWKGTPFIATSVLAGLQTISPEMYEAAEIDGAKAWKKFWYITLPLVRSTLLLATVMTTIWTINNFEGVWLLTGGGPAGSTQVLSIFTYLTAMSNNDIGRSMAISVLSMPFLIMLINTVAKRTFAEGDN